MNSQSNNTKAVSPVLAVILMVGVTVLLSTAIGVLVLDLGQATTTQEPSNLGVTITEHEPGTVKIHTKTGSTDSLRVLVNGEERVNQSVTSGDSTEITGVPENARISIIDASGSSEQVVVSQEVSNGDPFATAPTDVASIHANMSTNASGSLIITNVYELQAMNHNKNADYILGNDIHASSTQYWNDGEGFKPVGENGNRFTGSLDGDGYVIDGLYINRPNTDDVGLIGITDDSDISDIGVVNADVTGDDHVGGLVGENSGDVTSSYSTGDVSGDYDVGGLVGYNTGTVTLSYSTGDVSSESGDRVGGLVGLSNDNGNVTSSYSTGSVSGDDYVGGLVGVNSGDGTVTSSYSTGSVTGNSDVGGLVGYNNNGATVKSSYSTGSVTGNSDVGGLVGQNNNNVKSSYSTGSVTGNSDVGGLVGLNFGTVTSSYWDTKSSGQNSSSGSSISSGLTTIDMQGDSYNNTFKDDIVDSESFTGVTGEYPELAWESE